MTELTEAKDFYKLLRAKILSCRSLEVRNRKIAYKKGKKGRSCQNPDCRRITAGEKSCVGKKMMGYLNHAIPEWQEMDVQRLYAQAKQMHQSAEAIRKFEVDLLWKRLVYVVGFMFPFFAAFGVIAMQFADGKLNNDLAVPALFVTAVINTIFSLYLIVVTHQSHKWQKNWERNVHFLEEVLGINLMRMFLKKEENWLTVNKANMRIGFVMITTWCSISLVLFLFMTGIVKYIPNEGASWQATNWAIFAALFFVVFLLIMQEVLEMIFHGYSNVFMAFVYLFRKNPAILYKRKLKDYDFPIIETNSDNS